MRAKIPLPAALPGMVWMVFFGWAETAGKSAPSFEFDILPLLEVHCLTCHSQATSQGDLVLETLPSLLQGGKSGPAIVPTRPDRSLLLEKLITGQMPPGEKKLAEGDIEKIRRWIAEGAWPTHRAGPARAEAAPLPSVTEQEILPIFQIRCITCHGKRRQEGGLDLRTRASRLKGGRSGPALILGKPDESLLIQKIVSGEMPPVEQQQANSVRPPTEGELELLRRWIEAGAPGNRNPTDSGALGRKAPVTQEDRRFWSFQPPVRSPVPLMSHRRRVRNPIDAFLLQRLETQRLGFSPPANPLTLLRRAYLDLTGMPPSPAEAENYLHDQRPKAYERMIDRLLASPRYGERWGRYWLDLAGYSDSEGFGDHDGVRRFAWRYRDYVIRSLNQDKPYSQFLTEQIAGDELGDYRQKEVDRPLMDRLAATGFLRTTPDPTDAPERGFISERMNVIADEVEVLTSAILGLTIQCARCHDHKYDPISQQDYYRLSAILQTAYDPYEWLPPKKRILKMGLESEIQRVTAHNTPLEMEIGQLEERLLSLAEPFSTRLFNQRLAALPAELREELEALVYTPRGYEGSELARKFLACREVSQQDGSGIATYLIRKFKKTLEIVSPQLDKQFPEFKEAADPLRKQLDEAKGKILPKPYIRVLTDIGGRPSTTFVLKRGDPLTPGEPVQPSVPAVLTEGLQPYQPESLDFSTDSSGRRLALARWLGQPNHPLTSRVAVNQIWLRHFGRGLVPTPSNFGRSGKPPTHPELLDWLATELVRQEWKIKALHRLILTSTAYRQSSLIGASQRAGDPDNVLFSRMSGRRLDAEALYDSILKVTARLDATMFGPPEQLEIKSDKEVVAIGSDRGYRRSLYTLQRRYTPVSLLEAYDLPAMTPNCLQRRQSTVATQALHMMNGSVVWEHSRYMAGRVIDEVGNDLSRQVETSYWQVLARPPADWELQEGQSSLERFTGYWIDRLIDDREAAPVRGKARWLALASFCHTLLNSAEFSFVD